MVCVCDKIVTQTKIALQPNNIENNTMTDTKASISASSSSSSQGRTPRVFHFPIFRIERHRTYSHVAQLVIINHKSARVPPPLSNNRARIVSARVGETDPHMGCSSTRTLLLLKTTHTQTHPHPWCWWCAARFFPTLCLWAAHVAWARLALARTV